MRWPWTKAEKPARLFPTITTDNAQYCEGCTARALAGAELPPIYPFPNAFSITLAEWERIDPEHYWTLRPASEQSQALTDTLEQRKRGRGFLLDPDAATKKQRRPPQWVRPCFHDCNACVGLTICPYCFARYGQPFRPTDYVQKYLSPSTYKLHRLATDKKPPAGCPACTRTTLIAAQGPLVSPAVMRLKTMSPSRPPDPPPWEQPTRPDPFDCHRCLRTLPVAKFGSSTVCIDCDTQFLCGWCMSHFPTPPDTDRKEIFNYSPTERPCPECADMLRKNSGLDLASVVAWARRMASTADIAAPATEAPPDGLPIGTTGADNHPVWLSPYVRNRHVYVIGKTGSGKSSLLRNMVIHDMQAGRGVIFLDPHGDTAKGLLDYVPASRRDDVVYFCPVDAASPNFNLLATNYPPDKLTRDMVSAIKMFFGDSWGPRLNQLLTNALLTLLLDREHEPHSFADLQRMLMDTDYRTTVVRRCANRSLQSFWLVTFPTMGKDAVNPVLNKLSDMLMPTSPMERLFSSTDNALDLSHVMNSGKILLCNLAKGELGEAGAFLIGGLITTAIAQAALARTTIPEAERRDVFFYVDEFQNFLIDSFESILSEARKYRLNLTLAHQYLAQVPGQLQSAIFGNVAALICLQISAEDAATMRRELSTVQLVNTRTGEHYGRRPDFLAAQARAINYVTALDGGVCLTSAAARNIARRWNDERREPDPPLDVKETDWPTPHDFGTLPGLAGFVRIETKANVKPFRFTHPHLWTPPLHPNSQTGRAILEHQRAQHEKRRTQKPQEPRTPPKTADPTYTTSTKIPVADDTDDFLT